MEQTPCLGKLETILCSICYGIRRKKSVIKEGIVKYAVGKSCCQKTSNPKLKSQLEELFTDLYEKEKHGEE